MSPISAPSSSTSQHVASKSTPRPPPPPPPPPEGKSATVGIKLGANVASGKVAGTTITRAPLTSGQLLDIQA